MKKLHKIILDVDPGVDDITAIVFALDNPTFDIKLFCVTAGNVHMDKASRNLCHLLDIFNKDIPVVCGDEERLGDNTEHAYFIHGEEGCGNYVPPKTTKTKPIKKDSADAIYEVLKQHPKEITFVALASHTNLARLLMKYPDSKDLIKDVVMMGGSIDGILTNKNYCSFNIRTDAPAFDITLQSKLPVVMCPSKIGREHTQFSEEQVNQIKNMNQIGKFLALTYETYWEPDYPEKIIANCDLSALYYLVCPKLYKTKRAFVSVDLKEHIGKTTALYNRKGNFKIVRDIKRKPFMKLIFKQLEELGKIEITNKTFLKNTK